MLSFIWEDHRSDAAIPNHVFLGRRRWEWVTGSKWHGLCEARFFLLTIEGFLLICLLKKPVRKLNVKTKWSVSTTVAMRGIAKPQWPSLICEEISTFSHLAPCTYNILSLCFTWLFSLLRPPHSHGKETYFTWRVGFLILSLLMQNKYLVVYSQN